MSYSCKYKCRLQIEIIMYKFFIFFLFVNSSFCQTQIELNEKAKRQYDSVFKELNILQNKILNLNINNKKIQDKIISSHKIWLERRDSYMNAKYPLNERNDYGTYFPVRWYNELVVLTNNRIRQLKSKYFLKNLLNPF